MPINTIRLRSLLSVLLTGLTLLLTACAFTQTTRTDPTTHEPTDSVKMGFWDDAAFWLWGVAYDRFRFELTAVGNAPTTRWVAYVDCKNINDGPSFTITIDNVPRTYVGIRQSSTIIAYDIPASDVQAIAAAKRVDLSITHKDRHDDAKLRDDQLDALRDLYKRHTVQPL